MKTTTRISLFSLALCSLWGATSVHAQLINKGTPVKIMPLGDSITEGKFTMGGYRKPLLQLLKDAGYKVTFVGKEDNGDPKNDTGFDVGVENPNHEGYGSLRIDQLTKGGGAEGHTALPIEATLAGDKPDVILIMLGTNDILQDHDLGGIFQRMDHLLNVIFTTDKGLKVVLAAPTPMVGANNRGQLAAVYASGIPYLVDKYKALGDGIALADMSTALQPADLADGVHPKARGYAKMANVWFAALTGLTPPPVPDNVPAGPAPAPASAPAGDAGTAPAAPAGGGPAPVTGPTVAAPVGKQGILSFTSAQRDYAGGAFALGWRFQVGPADITVTALGYLNDGATGEQSSHTVGIFDNTSKQLVTPAVTVNTQGGALSGTDATFTYVQLPTPVKLTANTIYSIAGTTVKTGFLKNPKGVAFPPGIAPGSPVAVFQGPTITLVYPGHSISSNGAANIGPNFLTADMAAATK